MCRERGCIQRLKKRPALQEIDPNISPAPARRRATLTSQAPFSPSVINQVPIPLINYPVFLIQPVQPLLPVNPPVSPVQPPQPPPLNTFIPTDQWQTINDFHTHMNTIKIDTCTWCNAWWFDMRLKDDICYSCLLKDKGGQTTYFFLGDNEMDLAIGRAILRGGGEIGGGPGCRVVFLF